MNNLTESEAIMLWWEALKLGWKMIEKLEVRYSFSDISLMLGMVGVPSHPRPDDELIDKNDERIQKIIRIGIKVWRRVERRKQICKDMGILDFMETIS